MKKVDRTLSINQMRDWIDPPSEFRSSLVERHEAALATPLSELTPGQIAMLVRQKTELDVIVPIAIELLAEQPLLEAELYPGDLLAAILGLPTDFWQSHPDEWFDVRGMLDAFDNAVGAIGELRLTFEANAPRKHGEEVH